MKIRTDFVSNSSSSSFVIWGVTFNTEKIGKEIIKNLNEDKFNEIKEHSYSIDENMTFESFMQYLKTDEGEDFLDEVITDYFDNCCNKFNVLNDYDYGETYIGYSPTDMKDNETLAEFKQRILTDLSTMIPINLSKYKVEYISGVSSDDGFIRD